MMNMLDLQDKLKNLSEDQLVGQMRTPSGEVPQFLVLGEIDRRKRMRNDAQRQQGTTQSTVAQDVVTAAGVPQAGIAGMAQAMAPKTDMSQNTGIMSAAQAPEAPQGMSTAPQMMAGGGLVKMAEGGRVQSGPAFNDPVVIAMANREGMDVETYLNSLPPAQSKALQEGSAARAARGTTTRLENVFDPARSVSDQTGLQNGLTFEQRKLDALAALGVNPTVALGGLGADNIYGVGSVDRRGPDPVNTDTVPVVPGSAGSRVIGMSAPQLGALGESDTGFGSYARVAQAARDEVARERSRPPGLLMGERGTLPLAGYVNPINDFASVDSSPQAAPRADRQGYIPPNIGATELNTPIMRNALRVSPSAGLLTGLRNAAELRAQEKAAAPPRVYTPEEQAIIDSRGGVLDTAKNLADNYLLGPLSAAGAMVGELGNTVSQGGENVLGGVATMIPGLEGFAVDSYRRAEDYKDKRTQSGADAARILSEGVYPDATALAQEKSAAGPSIPKTPEQQAAAAEAERLAVEKKVADAAATAATTSGGSGGSGGGLGAGKSSQSDYEKMLMETLDNREKARNQDKWLALAEVGLGMMASQSPTLAGAVGEAGLKGAESYKKSRDQYDTDRMSIMGELEKYRQARAAAQAAASKAGAPKAMPAALLKVLLDQQAAAKDTLAGVPGAIPDGWIFSGSDPSAPDRLRAQQELDRWTAAVNAGLGSYGVGTAPTAGTPGVPNLSD